MKVKFAQYGVLHAHARGKAAVLKASSEVDFCGVYEPDPEARRAWRDAEAYAGVRWFESKEEMLDDQTVEAVAVEGEVGQNLEFAREAIGRGKHIWLDKPPGDDWEAFRALIAIAEDRGLLVQLGYMFRYHAGFRFILDWTRDQRLGDIFSVRGRMSTFLGGEARRQQSVYRGGILFELLCHLIDIVVAMLGRPERVTSFLRSDLSDGDRLPGQHGGRARVSENDGPARVRSDGGLRQSLEAAGGLRHPGKRHHGAVRAGARPAFVSGRGAGRVRQRLADRAARGATPGMSGAWRRWWRISGGRSSRTGPWRTS